MASIIKVIGVFMNTEHLFVLLLLIYMLVNVVTDVKRLITYNKWHLSFLIIFLTISLLQGNNVIVFLCTGVLMLIIGIIQSKIPGTSLGAGDIKMLVIVSLFLVAIKLESSLYLIIFFLQFGYMFTSLAITSFVKGLSLLKNNKEWSVEGFKITKEEIITPEAVPIFISVIIILIFF